MHGVQLLLQTLYRNYLTVETQKLRLNFSENLYVDTTPSENEQPVVATMQGVVLEVPVIDLGSPDEDNVVRLITEASREWGIFQLVNHGIQDDTIAKLQKVGKEFIELPKEERELVAKQEEYQGVEGYGTKLEKQVGGKRGLVDQLFHIIWPKSAINYHSWPTKPPLYREANEEYARALREVVDKLFEALSLGIGLERHELKEASGGDDLIYLLKINYYPPCPRSDLALGIVAHTDLSAITILVSNEVQGLQVLKDDHWYDVKYIPNALIILIGDQIEIMSNGKYKSVYHRATVNKEKTRMSWPVFLDPPLELRTGPISKLVTDENPSKFKTKKYEDYVFCKLNKLPQ